MVRSVKRKESGLDKFLRESMAEDPRFRAFFFAEVKKFPQPTRTLVLQNFRKGDA